MAFWVFCARYVCDLDLASDAIIRDWAYSLSPHTYLTRRSLLPLSKKTFLLSASIFGFLRMLPPFVCEALTQ